jgi:hypothetical protein
MAAIQTFGVVESVVEAHLPMLIIDSGTGTLLTSARLTTLITKSAARVNGLIDGAFGAGTCADIATDTVSVEYMNAQRLVLAALLPDCLRAAHHPPSVSSEITGLIADYAAQLEELISQPARALGRVTDSTSVSALRDSVRALGLDTTDLTKKRQRRHFDGRNALLGVDENGFQF